MINLVLVSDLETAFLRVLALAVGRSDAHYLEAVLCDYASLHNRLLYECRDNERLGIVGIEHITSDDARILHIAVAASSQRSGLGRKMIDALVDDLGYRNLHAETDADAIGFYRALGFEIESLGEQYPGVERFACTLRARRT